jgi:hypothetical protein
MCEPPARRSIRMNKLMKFRYGESVPRRPAGSFQRLHGAYLVVPVGADQQQVPDFRVRNPLFKQVERCCIEPLRPRVPSPPTEPWLIVQQIPMCRLPRRSSTLPRRNRCSLPKDYIT